MPQFRFGNYDFTFSGGSNFSGNAPKTIQGPERQMYVVEHQIPAREGGVVEYLGSEQSKYTFKGFIAPSQDGPYNGTAAQVLSGIVYLAVNSDDAKSFLQGHRGSGALLLLIESTNSPVSGLQNFYENGFFMMDKFTFALEAGKTYPYYPYSLDFKGVTPITRGYTSRSGTYSGAGFSGYIVCTFLNSGYVQSETINTLGFFANSAASGSAQMAYYYSNDKLGAQSTSQPVHSGWNYFPMNPSLSGATSGDVARIALMSNVTDASGWSLAVADTAQSVIAYNSVVSGQAFTAFPATISGLHINKSGFALVFVAVADH